LHWGHNSCQINEADKNRIHLVQAIYFNILRVTALYLHDIHVFLGNGLKPILSWIFSALVLGLLVFAPLEEPVSPTVDVSNKLLGFSSLVAARLASLSCFTLKFLYSSMSSSVSSIRVGLRRIIAAGNIDNLLCVNVSISNFEYFHTSLK